MAHTPGPWKYEGSHVEDGAFVGSRVVSVHPDFLYIPIADVPRTDLPARLDNAHLIAASPELYAIAKEIAKSIECCPICGCWPHASMCHLTAAISKAEGRESCDTN